MSQAFFAAKKDNSGGALIASFNSKDAGVYFKLSKQVNNNADKKNWDFSNGINVKFTSSEAAGMVRAIRTGGEFKFYHEFKGQDGVSHVTSGRLAFYSIAATEEGKSPRVGFGLSVKSGENTYKVGFTEDTAEHLKLYLEFALDHIFSSDYSEDKAKALEYQAKKNAEAGAKTTGGSKTKAPAPKPAPVEQEPEVEAPTEEADLF